MQAKAARTVLEDTAGLAQVLIETGMVLWRKGEYSQARGPLNEGLLLARQVSDKLKMALALNALGNVVSDQGDNTAGRSLFEESLALGERLAIRRHCEIAQQPGNFGITQGDYTAARALHEESLALRREIGHKGTMWYHSTIWDLLAHPPR